MDCKQASRVIQEYLDGETASDIQGELLRHVDICPGCRSKLESMKALTAKLDDMGLVAPGTAFTGEVMARLGLQHESLQEPARPFLSETSPLRVSWLSALFIWAKGAAVMAVVVLAFGMLNLFVPVQRSTARILSTDPKAQVMVAGKDVTVPIGISVKGNLTVLDGNLTLIGKVDGDVRIIRGSVRQMPGSQVTGRIVVIESPVAQARDAVMGAMDWFVSAYRQMTNRMMGN